ncbi:MAG: Gfo/Idh/MocA family oxidoreductase [Lentisphaerae bacterium]|jgi:predicted dehydrogenase|nr:Gfo/Idh/MocA family oxidoreductase [Lentisphaerota bacterium]
MGIKIGLVGLGSFGTAFAKLFTSHPLVDKVALCDCEADKIKKILADPYMASKVSPRDCYATLDEICKVDELDAVAIITQPWLHAPQCLQVMESGKSVYSAVPVISLPDNNEMLDWCGKLVEAVERTGRQYMLGETTIYRPQTMFCTRQAAAGAFGEFVYAEGEYVHDVDAGCNLRDVRRHRTTGIIGSQYAAFMKKYRDRGCRTSPMNYPTHSVSGPIYAMKTRAVKVSALGTPNTNNDSFFADNDFSNVTAFYQLANGASLRICEFREIGAGSIDRLESETFRIFGKSGSFSANRWEENGRTVEGTAKPLIRKDLTVAEMRDPLPPEVASAFKHAMNPNAAPGDDFQPSGHGGSHPYLVHEFVTSVAENREPAIHARMAAHFMAMGAAAHWSAQRDGELVKIPDIG